MTEPIITPIAEHGWVADFRVKHGRAPRVLHIGNIANNAYNNSKLLNEAGLDCDVLCYDYYHVMGCPEWEDCEFKGDVQDQFKPRWHELDLGGYERPRWFAQGPMRLCIDYLEAKRQGRSDDAERLWHALAQENLTEAPALGNLLDTAADAKPSTAGAKSSLSMRLEAYRNVLLFEPYIAEWMVGWARRRIPGADKPNSLRGLFTVCATLPAILVVRALHRAYRSLGRLIGLVWQKDGFDIRAAELVALFARRFPERADKLTHQDLNAYRFIVPELRRLMKQYDLVQAYSTDPILAMLANAGPYVAFEHGTLRAFTQGNDPISRLTSLAYNLADHSFITNGDCLEFARLIHVSRYSPMLHPIDERRIWDVSGDYDSLHREMGVKHVFLCTIRHDWAVKGTDKYIRALPALRAAIGGDFVVLMANWGAQLKDSRNLARELGVADRIRWIEPLPKRSLCRMQKSVDILFDQIALPHFGATAPEGIAAGVPVIMSYDRNSTDWIVSEPAPVLSAWTVEEIVERVLQALDPVWIADYRVRAARWIQDFHSYKMVVNGHMSVYERLLVQQSNGKGGQQ